MTLIKLTTLNICIMLWHHLGNVSCKQVLENKRPVVVGAFCGAELFPYALYYREFNMNMHEWLMSSNAIASLGIVFPLWVSLLILSARQMESFLAHCVQSCNNLGGKNFIGGVHHSLGECRVRNHVSCK